MQPYLANVLNFGPTLIEAAYRRVPKDSTSKPTHPGRFSPNEVLAHLADWEGIFLERMRQSVRDPRYQIVPEDEGERAERERYKKWDPEETIKLFRQRRAESQSFIANLSQDQLEILANHPELGPTRIGDLANMLLGHDLYHLQQLEDASRQ
jgi:hypothetical protein